MEFPGYYVRHIDTDANVVRHYGPFESKELAEAKVAHLLRVGHHAEVICNVPSLGDPHGGVTENE